MAEQNLQTNYTETDPLGKITLTSTKCDWASLQRGTNTWVYYDFGAAYFSGDFDHAMEIDLTAKSAGCNPIFYALQNIVGSYNDVGSASGDAIQASYYSNTPTLYLREIDGGTNYDTTYGVSSSTVYYPVISRDETVGTYGTVYLYLYSDSARTTLVTTMSVTLHSSKKDYQYHYAYNSVGAGSGSQASTGYVDHIDLAYSASGGTTYYQTNTGSITGTGIVTKSTMRTLSGSVTGSGSISKATARTLAGSITNTGNINKKTSRSLSGSSTPSGALTSRSIIVQAISGSITMTGSIAKKTMKSLAGSITNTGAITKKIGKILSGSSTPTGSINKKTSRALSGSITVTGALATAYITYLTVTGSITISGIVAGVKGIAQFGRSLLMLLGVG